MKPFAAGLVALWFAAHAGSARADAASNTRPTATWNAQSSAPDVDQDGVPDALDRCRLVPAGDLRDPLAPGCPLRDRDGDGVQDARDQCPDQPAGRRGDPARLGCPLMDTDGDGVDDARDACPSEARGPHPDPDRLGCADHDSDADGVYDAEDACPGAATGLHGDPARPGCPIPDRDHDGVPDGTDRCPDVAGAPDARAERSGCPDFLRVTPEIIRTLRAIRFDTAQVRPVSLPVLDAVAHVLRTIPGIRRVRIDGYTDDVGAIGTNLDLSDARAREIRRLLIERGIPAERLEIAAHGESDPAEAGTSARARSRNRRVEFRILELGPPR